MKKEDSLGYEIEETVYLTDSFTRLLASQQATFSSSLFHYSVTWSHSLDHCLIYKWKYLHLIMHKTMEIDAKIPINSIGIYRATSR